MEKGGGERGTEEHREGHNTVKEVMKSREEARGREGRENKRTQARDGGPDGIKDEGGGGGEVEEEDEESEGGKHLVTLHCKQGMTKMINKYDDVSL